MIMLLVFYLLCQKLVWIEICCVQPNLVQKFMIDGIEGSIPECKCNYLILSQKVDLRCLLQLDLYVFVTLLEQLFSDYSNIEGSLLVHHKLYLKMLKMLQNEIHNAHCGSWIGADRWMIVVCLQEDLYNETARQRKLREVSPLYRNNYWRNCGIQPTLAYSCQT